jgi:hypothetical protein
MDCVGRVRHTFSTSSDVSAICCHSHVTRLNAQHHIWANQQHVSDGIMQSWQYHNAVHDHAMQQWSDATLGVTHLMNPDTGVVHTVQNDFDQYWATNDGTILGGSWATQPDPSWHHLEPVKL